MCAIVAEKDIVMVMHTRDIEPLFALIKDTFMALHIKDVNPLYALTEEIKLIGIVPCGAKNGKQLVGFCQALFPYIGDPEGHTTHITESLSASGAYFSKSHELFLGHCSDKNFGKWFDSAARPLYENTGCVPVLITGL